MSIYDAAATQLTSFLMPDDGEPDTARADALSGWMEENGLQTGKGRIAEFLTRTEFAPFREKAVSELSDQENCRDVISSDLTSKEADRLMRLLRNEGCTARKRRQSDGKYTVIGSCPC